jgi:hypothetical protein
MIDRDAQFREALSLVRRALVLLDDLGHREAAIHVQSAVDEMTNAQPPASIAEAEVFLESPEGRTLLARLDLDGLPCPTVTYEAVAVQ